MKIELDDYSIITNVGGDEVVEREAPDCGDYLTPGCGGYIFWKFDSIKLCIEKDFDSYADACNELVEGAVVSFKYSFSDDGDYDCDCEAIIESVSFTKDIQGNLCFELTVSGGASTTLSYTQSDSGWRSALGL